MRYVVDWMRLGDIPAVGQIEKEAFGETWPAGSYEREIVHNRLAHYLVLREVREKPDAWKPAVELLYASSPEDDYWSPPPPGDVVGHVGMWLMFDESHITTIAVRNSHRGRGLGELLLIAAIEVSSSKYVNVVTLEVRVSNLAAQALYEKYGFAKAGLRRGYYSDNHEDALIMTSEPIDSVPFQDRFRRLRESNMERLTHLCASRDP